LKKREREKGKIGKKMTQAREATPLHRKEPKMKGEIRKNTV
jgi:hypothetical protein